MQYTQLRRSGLKVSRLCLGPMNFGPHTGEADARSIMDLALEPGINFFDTANVYGGAGHRGRAEEILGRWFATGGERRERTVLATKLYGTMADRPKESRLSALNIRRALDARLKRLQTDYIDLYQQLCRLAHRPGAGSCRTAPQQRPRQRTIHLQPADRNVELEVIPAAQQYGLGLIPWSPREQLDAALRAVDPELDAGVLQRLDEIFPAYRTAPEDYAW